MSTAVRSTVEKERPGAFWRVALGLTQVALMTALGWLGTRALLEVVVETREHDAAAARESLEARPAPGEHPAAAEPGVAAPAPALPGKGKPRAATPGVKAIAGRVDAKKTEAKGK